MSKTLQPIYCYEHVIMNLLQHLPFKKIVNSAVRYIYQSCRFFVFTWNQIIALLDICMARSSSWSAFATANLNNTCLESWEKLSFANLVSFINKIDKHCKSVLLLLLTFAYVGGGSIVSRIGVRMPELIYNKDQSRWRAPSGPPSSLRSLKASSTLICTRTNVLAWWQKHTPYLIINYHK